MTTMTTLAALSAACAMLSSCGGGASTPPAPPPAPAPVAPQQFVYLPPAAGETDVWTRVLTDSAGNSVAMQIRQQIASVDESGVRVVTYDDPTGTDVAEDGLDFRVNPETEHVSATGTASDYTLTSSSGAQTTCVYGTVSGSGTGTAEATRATAQGLRRLESLSPGEAWNSAYTIACGSAAPVAYSVTAAVFPLETVTVAAGTFQAFRETVDTTWVFNGFTNSTSVTLWRDPARSMFAVRLDEAIVHGDTSKPYFTHETRELLSRQ